MALIDDFKARFPEFATATVDTYIPILTDVWPCYWGGVYDDDACNKEIVLNLLAHLLSSETSSGSGNLKSVNQKSVGNVSVSYSQGIVVDSERKAWFSTTKYGMRYMMLTRHRQGGVFV